MCLQDLLFLEEQLGRLKDKAADSQSGGETEPVGDRLAKLQQDAGTLANTTEDIMQALKGKTVQPHPHKSGCNIFFFFLSNVILFG